ncbi:MAG: hypothetical protein ACKPKO_03230, partial [Candidatus Fonsibacter sp.]
NGPLLLDEKSISIISIIICLRILKTNMSLGLGLGLEFRQVREGEAMLLNEICEGDIKLLT